jgi:hypothetical protein
MTADTQEQDHKPAAAPDAEQAADLAAMTAAAAGEPAAPGAAAPPAEQAQPVNLAADLAGLTELAVTMAAPMFPRLRQVYTPETIEAAAAVSARLCEKHGWLQDGVGGKYAEEIAAGVVLAPLAYSTYAAITADMADQKRQAQADKEKPGALQDAPGSAHATVGGQVVDGAQA